ncbi:MAG: hypothetical protein R2795_12300 [Saprospiraceae bacterium]
MLAPHMMKKHLLYFFLLALVLVACVKQPAPLLSGMGKKPIYLSLDALDNIANLPPRDVESSGSIFLLDTLFFLMEQGQGIHVFSVSDPENPTALTFLQIPAISAYTINGNRLFANCWRDLVTIDISNLYAIQSIDRQEGVFDPLLFPPLFNGIFECVDETKGAVVKWEDAALENVACSTIN